MTKEEPKAIIVAELNKVAPESDPGRLGLDEDLREALDIDSFSFLRVLVGVSEHTGVDIPEADYGKVTTLAAMIRYLAVRQG